MERDRELVAKQLGRPPRAFARVVVRCPFGRPAVTEQSPYDDSGEPFPTTYYVTCRHLVAAISRLEAAGGVERWSERAQHEPDLAASLVRATEEQRRVRTELAAGRTGSDRGASLELGIGGSRNPEQLKCLHAHVAYAMARPGYELGERIADEVVPLWPERCCMEGQTRPYDRDRRDRVSGTAAARGAHGAVAVENARLQWEEGYRRLNEHASDRPIYLHLLAQVDVLIGELNRRVGQTFTLADLAAAYDDADRWLLEVLPPGAGAVQLGLVEDAAFHLYARGAVDYAP